MIRGTLTPTAMVSRMALTTLTAMAYRTAAPGDRAAEGLVEVLAEGPEAGPAACPKAVADSTRSGEHPLSALAGP